VISHAASRTSGSASSSRAARLNRRHDFRRRRLMHHVAIARHAAERAVRDVTMQPRRLLGFDHLIVGPVTIAPPQAFVPFAGLTILGKAHRVEVSESRPLPKIDI
jgi:hypothetical protein